MTMLRRRKENSFSRIASICLLLIFLLSLLTASFFLAYKTYLYDGSFDEKQEEKIRKILKEEFEEEISNLKLKVENHEIQLSQILSNLSDNVNNDDVEDSFKEDDDQRRRFNSDLHPNQNTFSRNPPGHGFGVEERNRTTFTDNSLYPRYFPGNREDRPKPIISLSSYKPNSRNHSSFHKDNHNNFPSSSLLSEGIPNAGGGGRSE